MISAWNDDTVAALQKLHASGLSCSQIAAALNRQFKFLGVTRNAVIGKLARLGVQREAPSRPARVAPPKPAPQPARKPPAKASARNLPPTTPAEPVVIAPSSPSLTARPFGERKIGECWWPIGEGAEMQSCCAKVERGGLCGVHAERGYQKPGTQAQRKKAASTFLYHAGRIQQGFVLGKRGGSLAE